MSKKLFIGFYDSHGNSPKSEEFEVEESDLNNFVVALNIDHTWVGFKDLVKGMNLKFRSSSVAYIKY